jgi:GntR family transcriptional regulator of vanillate catabolism
MVFCIQMRRVSEMVDALESVQAKLRRMILTGELSAGQKLTEEKLADLLGVSRTPIREAILLLAGEGLLERVHRRGYHVRKISKEAVMGAVEVRSVLEGLAARQAAERGLSEKTVSELQRCLDKGDELFQGHTIDEEKIAQFASINRDFHEAIIDASGNASIRNALNHNAHLPFASPNAIYFHEQKLEREYKRFFLAHQQHHLVFGALVNGQSGRAQALMAEHAYVAVHFVGVDIENMTFHKALYQSPAPTVVGKQS